jgi:hypothetical protein
VRWIQDHPGDLLPAARYVGGLVGRAWRDMIAARGRVNRISFFLHNFMDACHLEPDRIKACSFYTVTRDGPVSMCLANAKRDDFILQPVKLARPDGKPVFWQPLTGEVQNAEGTVEELDPTSHPLNRLKGRSRALVWREREREKARAAAARSAPSSTASS